MPTFKKPNLNAESTVDPRPFVSVHGDRRVAGINTAFANKVDLDEGDRVVFARDRSYRPWIGFSDEVDPSLPAVHTQDDRNPQVNSTLLCRHLVELIDGKVEGAVRTCTCRV